MSTVLCLAIVLEGRKGFPGCGGLDGRKQAKKTLCSGACNKHAHWDWTQSMARRYTNKGWILWYPPQTGSTQTKTILFIKISIIWGPPTVEHKFFVSSPFVKGLTQTGASFVCCVFVVCHRSDRLRRMSKRGVSFYWQIVSCVCSCVCVAVLHVITTMNRRDTSSILPTDGPLHRRSNTTPITWNVTRMGIWRKVFI